MLKFKWKKHCTFDIWEIIMVFVNFRSFCCYCCSAEHFPSKIINYTTFGGISDVFSFTAPKISLRYVCWGELWGESDLHSLNIDYDRPKKSFLFIKALLKENQSLDYLLLCEWSKRGSASNGLLCHSLS